MYLEIVSPEATLFSGQVSSVIVPGTDGEFEMLNNHVAIVALLQKGDVKFKGSTGISDEHKAKFTSGANGEMVLPINSGTVEMSDNKVIVLAD